MCAYMYVYRGKYMYVYVSACIIMLRKLSRSVIITIGSRIFLLLEADCYILHEHILMTACTYDLAIQDRDCPLLMIGRSTGQRIN